jgi:uncharacterized protein
MRSSAGVNLDADDFEALGLLVIQPTPLCNIDCQYCYLPNRKQTRRMLPDTYLSIPNFLAGIPTRAPELSIVWHAGEPTVLPPSYYEPIFQSFAESPTLPPVIHNFQTNATLIDDEWCAFIKKWNIKIGVSLDGPAAINDLYRIDRAGRGTTVRALRGVEALKRHEIPFTILGVLTSTALERPDDVWRFMVELGASGIAFNLEEQEGAHALTSLERDDAAPRVRRFFSRIAQLRSTAAALPVRELDNMRRHLTAPPGSAVQCSNNRPGAILNIDVEGNVTTFSPELLDAASDRYGAFSWGNVKTATWRALADNPGFRRAWADIAAGIDKCKSQCEYFAVCGGGNPSNKMAESGSLDIAETKHCRLAVKAIADVVIESIEAELCAEALQPAARDDARGGDLDDHITR